MKPFNSGGTKETCSPISSNCVIWQGPDLPCLHLCKGDTVSDVVYKLAEEVCELKNSIGLSDVDLDCLLQICQTTPEPAKTLTNILTLLINKVCCINDIIENLPPPGNNYTEPTFNLTSFCSELTGGGVITSLIHSQFTLRIATVLCSTINTVNNQSVAIANLDTRVTALENPTIVTPQISSCLLGTLATVEDVVQELETQFCAYKTVLGSTGNITTAIGKQCTNLNSQKQLATGLPMTTLPGWVSSVSNLGQSITNLWLTVCDLRGAVQTILDNCCKVDCNSIIIDFDYKWKDSTTLTMFFSPKSFLPIGFYDCNDAQGNTITIKDSNGNTYDAFFHFRRQDPNDLTGILSDPAIIANGYDLDLSSPNAVDVTLPLTFSSPVLCFTNGDVTCVKCFDKDVTGYVNKDCCTITNTGNTNVTITYKICIPTT